MILLDTKGFVCYDKLNMDIFRKPQQKGTDIHAEIWDMGFARL